MKFGTIPVDQAIGVILAHTMRTAAFTFKKGRTLSSADVTALKGAGITHVIGARLGPGDIIEDDAAARIAAHLAGPHMKLSESHTGRCNIEAAKDGVVLIDAAAINAVNLLDESITIATLADKAPAKAGQIVATVKIIPFAVSADTMSRAEQILRGGGAVKLSPYTANRTAIISTLLPGLKESVVSNTESLTQQRVKAVSGSVASVVRCAHVEDDVKQKVHDAVAAGADLVLIASASATVDRADVAPSAVVAAGGVIDHFGMPVDPGNLLVLGHVGAVPVLILPGCARSPKLNGFDWVLQRLAANIPVTRADIMGMGVGGLLVDTPTRPLPRESAVKADAGDGTRKICAVVLAAGQSRRMGSFNKLLMPLEGVPLVRRTVDVVAKAKLGGVVVVTGHQADEVKSQLKGLDVKIVHNPRFDEGLSTSLKTGLDAVPADCDGAIICLGDMPGISPAHLQTLAAGFDPAAGKAIGIPTHRGKRGNPVLWSRRFFDEMKTVSGDVGARHLIGANESLVYEVEFGDTAVLTDLDTPQQWADFLAGRPRE